MARPRKGPPKGATALPSPAAHDPWFDMFVPPPLGKWVLFLVRNRVRVGWRIMGPDGNPGYQSMLNLSEGSPYPIIIDEDEYQKWRYLPEPP